MSGKSHDRRLKRAVLNLLPAPEGMWAHFEGKDGKDDKDSRPVRALAVCRVDVYGPEKRIEAEEFNEVCGLINSEIGLLPAEHLDNFTRYSFPDERAEWGVE